MMQTEIISAVLL